MLFVSYCLAVTFVTAFFMQGRIYAAKHMDVRERRWQGRAYSPHLPHS